MTNDKFQMTNWVLVLVFGILSFAAPVHADSINDKIENAIKDYVMSERSDWEDDNIKVSFSGAENMTDKYLNDQNVQVKVSENYNLSKITPRMLIPLIFKGGGKIENVNLWVRLEVFKEIATAKERIKRNAVIKDDDLSISNKEVALLPMNYYERKNDIIGKVAKINIEKGAVIFEAMVKTKPDVAKGAKVNIKSSSDGIVIDVSGIALEDGRIGDTIKVKRLDSSKSLDAVVNAQGEVEVKL
ncbi:flagellar basal body P-ring formation protein FlgA [Candidatus Saganbacteria bacterium]|nr:flagellar basal body P-ring formation protein FlgA [Candidatus Saganbacteria bacterium]